MAGPRKHLGKLRLELDVQFYRPRPALDRVSKRHANAFGSSAFASYARWMTQSAGSGQVDPRRTSADVDPSPSVLVLPQAGHPQTNRRTPAQNVLLASFLMRSCTDGAAVHFTSSIDLVGVGSTSGSRAIHRFIRQVVVRAEKSGEGGGKRGGGGGGG